jgi:hypothetical protein
MSWWSGLFGGTPKHKLSKELSLDLSLRKIYLFKQGEETMQR